MDKIKFCVLDIGIIPSLFLLMYSQVILSLDEKPALSYYQRTILIGGVVVQHPSPPLDF